MARGRDARLPRRPSDRQDPRHSDVTCPTPAISPRGNATPCAAPEPPGSGRRKAANAGSLNSKALKIEGTQPVMFDPISYHATETLDDGRELVAEVPSRTMYYGDTLLNPLLAAGFGPRFRGLGSRPVRVAILSRKAGDPSGRPIVSAPRSAAIASSEAGASIRSPNRPLHRSSSGVTVTSASSRAARCARTLDQRQSQARAASPARTGFSATKRTA